MMRPDSGYTCAIIVSSLGLKKDLVHTNCACSSLYQESGYIVYSCKYQVNYPFLVTSLCLNLQALQLTLNVLRFVLLDRKQTTRRKLTKLCV